MTFFKICRRPEAPDSFTNMGTLHFARPPRRGSRLCLNSSPGSQFCLRLREGNCAMFGTSAPDLPFDTPELNSSSESSDFVCICCNCDRVRNRSGEWRDDHTPA